MDSFFNIMDSSIADTSLDELWRVHLGNEFSKPYFLKLKQFLKKEKQEHDIYPSIQNVFNAFRSTPLNAVKVVVLGQDPYHGEGQAHGLSFSVPKGIKIPPSLRNIIYELKQDLGINLINTSLEHWAEQGIILLNASLTVIEGTPASHINLWSDFTDYIISELNKQDKIIFVAWGAFANKKLKNVDINKHDIIISSHPSPLSCHKKYKDFPPFNGSQPFTKINDLLKNRNIKDIDW